jgi:hypothetical protein
MNEVKSVCGGGGRLAGRGSGIWLVYEEVGFQPTCSMGRMTPGGRKCLGKQRAVCVRTKQCLE